MQMRPMSMVVWGEKKTADVVAYITSLPDPENAAVTLGGDPTVGQANYMVCAACHGANGEGNQALNAPRIAGQFDWYTHRQLMNWKNGVRCHSYARSGAQHRVFRWWGRRSGNIRDARHSPVAGAAPKGKIQTI